MYMQAKNNRGFTLIELLMVVAIISIIASIVIAVLNSARDGARNANRNEVARQYIIAMGIYQNTYGVYPTGGCSVGANCGGDAVWVCLGDQPGNSCHVFEAHTENSTTNSQLAEFIPALPALTDPVVTTGQTFTGLAYGCTEDTGPDACKSYRLSWVLEGGADEVECYGGATEIDATAATICTFSTE